MSLESQPHERNDLEGNEGVERNLDLKMEIQRGFISRVCGYDDSKCVENWINNPENSGKYNEIFQQMLRNDPKLEYRWNEDSASVLDEIEGLMERKKAA